MSPLYWVFAAVAMFCLMAAMWGGPAALLMLGIVVALAFFAFVAFALWALNTKEASVYFDEDL